jgi:hypothetical protein
MKKELDFLFEFISTHAVIPSNYYFIQEENRIVLMDEDTGSPPIEGDDISIDYDESKQVYTIRVTGDTTTESSAYLVVKHINYWLN